MKRRWPLLLLAALLMLISIALAVTLLSTRSIEGAVPGKAPLLGLAVVQGQFLAASETGLYLSPDGKTWSKPRSFSKEAALLAGIGPKNAIVLSGRGLFRFDAPGSFRLLLPGPTDGTALGSSGGSAYIARGINSILVIGPPCLSGVSPDTECRHPESSGTLRLRRGPSEILALDAAPSNPVMFFAGGLRSGVWRSAAPELRWQKVLATATRAVLVDDLDPRRIYIGTAGGLLVSKDQGLSWSFTDLREPVEALAQWQDTLFALAGNRLVFRSSDGERWAPANS